MAEYEKNGTVTDDLSRFGFIELKEAAKLLSAYCDDKMTPLARESFDGEGVHIAFNTDSGKVFLSNDEYQVLMLNEEGILDYWVWCSEHGSEGFLKDLAFDAENGNVPAEDCNEILENFDNYLSDEQREVFKKAAWVE